jgi:hypothetical protein
MLLPVDGSVTARRTTGAPTVGLSRSLDHCDRILSAIAAMRDERTRSAPVARQGQRACRAVRLLGERDRRSHQRDRVSSGDRSGFER